MSKRHKDWARRARDLLLRQLGNACAHCGSTNDLTFDCIERCGHRHHAMDTSARMCFYRKQARAGNLRILCARCHCKEQNTVSCQAGSSESLRGHTPTIFSNRSGVKRYDQKPNPVNTVLEEIPKTVVLTNANNINNNETL